VVISSCRRKVRVTCPFGTHLKFALLVFMKREREEGRNGHSRTMGDPGSSYGHKLVRLKGDGSKQCEDGSRYGPRHAVAVAQRKF